MSSLRIYIAGCFARRAEFRVYAAQLRDLGHTITARWLDTPLGVDDTAWYASASPQAIVAEAHRDLCDIHDADVLLCFTDRAGIDHSRGSHHFECGAALAWNKEIWIVGERKHLFHWLSEGEEQMRHFADWEAALAWIVSVQTAGAAVALPGGAP